MKQCLTRKTLMVASIALALAACGGGGGDTTNATPTPVLLLLGFIPSNHGVPLFWVV